jgi:hypothetical protein
MNPTEPTVVVAEPVNDNPKYDNPPIVVPENMVKPDDMVKPENDKDSTNYEEPFKINLDVFPTKNKTSKGFYIGDYRISYDKSQIPYNFMESVDHYLENLIRYAKKASKDVSGNDVDTFFDDIFPSKRIEASLFVPHKYGGGDRIRKTRKNNRRSNRNKYRGKTYRHNHAVTKKTGF